MKIIITVSVILLLAACTPPTGINTAKARFLCKEEGGLHSWASSNEYPVVCNSGKKVNRKEIENTIITDPEYFYKKEM